MERLGESHLCKTMASAVTSITNIYSLVEGNGQAWLWWGRGTVDYDVYNWLYILKYEKFLVCHTHTSRLLRWLLP